MVLQYSSLSNPPSLLTQSSSSGVGTYSNTLSDPNTNSLNLKPSELQSISGSVNRVGGGGRTRRRSRRSCRNKRRMKRGGSRYRRSSRRRFN